MAEPTFDLTAAHRFFSADCFNRAWDEMDKANRSPEDDETMLLLAFASYYHWTQRPDCTPTARSVSCWQISRIYALLRQAQSASFWAGRSLGFSLEEGVEPFYRGYAFEALARAALLSARAESKSKLDQIAATYLAQAHEEAEKIVDEESRQMLMADLASLA
jgi:hypothetical protein